MNNKYQYHCKKCGHTVLSDSKAEVQMAKHLHRARVVNGPSGSLFSIPKCKLVDTGRGTMARKELAAIIKERMVDGYSS